MKNMKKKLLSNMLDARERLSDVTVEADKRMYEYKEALRRGAEG